MITNNRRERLVFYHGTTNVLNVGKVLLPPLYTGNLREDWRKNNQDVVYMTTSLSSAIQYAKKACAKYGGEPVIYKVNPIGGFYCRMNQEYITEKAKIVEIVNT